MSIQDWTSYNRKCLTLQLGPLHVANCLTHFLLLYFRPNGNIVHNDLELKMNPYSNLPKSSFWSRSVARLKPELVDPVMQVPFLLGQHDLIATAGSCFAQHIAKTLVASGYNYLVAEDGPEDQNYGVFPARFGNIYTTRQLVQLFQRAYGLFDPEETAWQLKNGRFVDPFRPRVAPDGFGSIEELEQDRKRHLIAVQEMFERSSVFIFTLGLTEGWLSKVDGASVPLAPGVHGGDDRLDSFIFHNASVSEMVEDMRTFIDQLRTVNPAVKIILTVSPVPLVATYSNNHVLSATSYSKSALRVVAEEIVNKTDRVAYFPSYEIVTGQHNKGIFFEKDLREIKPDGVKHVMSIFKKHYLGSQPKEEDASHNSFFEEPVHCEQSSGPADLGDESIYQIICDEEAIES